MVAGWPVKHARTTVERVARLSRVVQTEEPPGPGRAWRWEGPAPESFGTPAQQSGVDRAVGNQIGAVAAEEAATADGAATDAGFAAGAGAGLGGMGAAVATVGVPGGTKAGFENARGLRLFDDFWEGWLFMCVGTELRR